MITILTGDDSFALKQALDERMKSFVAAHGELALERLDGEEDQAEHIFDAITGFSLLSSAKMVVLRGASKQKELLEKLADKPELVPETTELLLVDSKLDKRARYYKAFKKTADLQEYNVGDKDTAGWLVDYAKNTNGTLTRQDASYLIDRVGTNKTMLANEIDKLVAYDTHITRGSIDLLCEPTPQSSVFQLLDAAFNGNIQRTMALYEDQRSQRVEPLSILGMIAWQLQIVAIVHTGPGDATKTAQEAKLNPYVVRKSQAIARNLSKTELRKLIRRALNLDVQLKSTAVDADEAVRYFLVSVAQTM